MLNTLRGRAEWKFFAVLPRADARLASAWWLLVLLRGVLPAVFAIAMGVLVGAVQKGESLVSPLLVVGAVFVLLQVLAPLHQATSANLGSRVAAWLYDRLTEACVKPPGMGHLEDPELTSDLTVAREFDAAHDGAADVHQPRVHRPSGLVTSVTGVASALVLFGFAWWAPLLLGGAWALTHYLLRESAVWRDRNTAEVRGRAAARGVRVSAGRGSAGGEGAAALRASGLGDGAVRGAADAASRAAVPGDAAARAAARLESAIVLAANVIVFWALASAALAGRIDLAHVVVYAQVAVGVSAIAFGRLSWALDGAAAPVAAVLRLEAAMDTRGALVSPVAPRSAAGLPSPTGSIRFRDVSFAYPGGAQPVLEGFDLSIPAGSSLAIVGQNGAGKTTLAKLLCRLYDPQAGAILVDGVDLRELALDSWRAGIAAVFQDFIRFELPLRDNVAPFGAPDDVIRQALAEAGASGLARLDTPLARGYDDGIELSGGQWQRVALARALCAVRMGARLVLLDEPTAQLDVRGEAFVFDRILAATRKVTTILISHRFSTVRHADRICVLEHGRVVELGTHDELDGAGRALPHDVRPAGEALHGRHGRGRHGV